MTLSETKYYKMILLLIPVLWMGLMLYSRYDSQITLLFGENKHDLSILNFGLIITVVILVMMIGYYSLKNSQVPLGFFRAHFLLASGAIVFFLIYKFYLIDIPLFSPDEIKENYEVYIANKQKYQKWESLYFLCLFCSIMSFAVNMIYSLILNFKNKLNY